MADPEQPTAAAALEAAIELAQRRELERAKEAARTAPERDPTFARAYNVLGIIQFQRGSLDAAEVEEFRPWVSRFLADGLKRLGKIAPEHPNRRDCAMPWRSSRSLDPLDCLIAAFDRARYGARLAKTPGPT